MIFLRLEVVSTNPIQTAQCSCPEISPAVAELRLKSNPQEINEFGIQQPEIQSYQHPISFLQ